MAAPDPLAPAAPAAPATEAAKPPGKFVKLPGRPAIFRLRGYGQVQLHLTDAFLLQIDVIAMREVYSKFAYKDIQAIEVVRTVRWAVWNWLFGLLTVLVGLTLLIDKRGDEQYVAAGFAGFFAALLVINVVRGPTCRSTLRTLTGRHVLRSLVRLRPARKALAQIIGRIDAVQGSLDQPTAEREMENLLARRGRETQARAATPPPA